MADLQEIVDDLEAAIRRPISVEDRRWRLLAHSVQPDEADAVRRSSILTRETAPDVVAWLDGLGLQRAHDLVDVPRNDDLGMTRRGCLPIRHGDVLLGFLWVIVGDRPLSGAERESLGRGGEEVAENLWRRHRDSDERERRTREELDALLRGQESQLAATLRWPQTGAYAIAVTDVRNGAVALAPRRSGRDRRRAARAGPDAFHTRARRRRRERRSERAVRAAQRRARGASSGARRRALRAGRARAGGRLRRARQLGPDRVAVGRRRPPAPPATIVALAEHRRGAQLLEALEGLLEHGGDVAEAARALSMHRATLYRRLERIEEITGLDLRRGDDRLLAHLGLRLHRLAATVAS